MDAQPAAIPPPPAAAPTTTTKKKLTAKKQREINTRKDTKGTKVYALASVVLSAPVATKKFGTQNYNKTYIWGVVQEAFDGRKKEGKGNAVWKLKVKWYYPGHPEGQVWEIRRQDAHLEQPQANPTTTVGNFADSIDHRDVPMKGSTTYLASASNDGPPNAAATAGGGGGGGDNSAAREVAATASSNKRTSNNSRGGDSQVGGTEGGEKQQKRQRKTRASSTNAASAGGMSIDPSNMNVDCSKGEMIHVIFLQIHLIGG